MNGMPRKRESPAPFLGEEPVLRAARACSTQADSKERWRRTPRRGVFEVVKLNSGNEVARSLDGAATQDLMTRGPLEVAKMKGRRRRRRRRSRAIFRARSRYVCIAEVWKTRSRLALNKRAVRAAAALALFDAATHRANV